MVGHARGNLDALLGGKNVVAPRSGNRERTSENKEELPTALVVVRNLGNLRRQVLLNDADTGTTQKVPAIAARAPRVMLGGGGRNRLG